MDVQADLGYSEFAHGIKVLFFQWTFAYGAIIFF